MEADGLIIDYHGLIDCQSIDSILTNLKKMKFFRDLTTIVRKRTYSLVVECTENILKHSVCPPGHEAFKLPEVSLRNTDDRIIIRTGNTVSAEKQEKIKRKIEEVNGRNATELRKMHEERINTEYGKGENGAGLGFICMAMKSGNKLVYSFRPVTDDYLFFELEISVNK